MRGSDIHGAIQPTTRQRGRCFHMLHMNGLALFMDAHAVAQWFTQRAIFDLTFVNAIGHSADGGTGGGLTPALHHGGQRGQILQPIFFHECHQALRAQRIGRHHGFDIA